MGWWSNLWDGIKRTASNVWSGIKSGVNWVAEKVKPVVDTVRDYAGKIPVFGSGIANVAGTVSDVIGGAKKLTDAATAAGYRRGGVVMAKKFQAS